MNRKVATHFVTVLLLTSTLYLSFTILPQTARATTLYVGGSGLGNYTTIQSAIDAANAGDIVYVYNGTYSEHVIVDKTLSLVGEARDITIIDGGETPETVNITADWVNLTSITVMGGGAGWEDAGVKLFSVQNCTIENVRASPNMRNGLYLYASHNNRIINNIILDSHFAMELWYSNYNYISGNNISKKNGVGLWISSSNVISNNIALDNYDGVTINYFSDNNLVDNNTVVATSSEYGIRVWKSNSSTISRNTISATNGKAISLEYSSGDILSENVMTDSGIWIFGDSLRHWNSHTIDISNTANGEPVYYWKNISGGVIPPNAGQVILANCTDIILENQNVSNTYAGIELGFSRNNIIANNTASFGFLYGIYLAYSSNNLLDNNTASHNHKGVRLFFSNNNTIVNNVIDFSGSAGVFLSPGFGNVFVNNFLTSNDWAFQVGNFNYNIFTRNDIVGGGFNVFASDNNRFLSNNISDMGIGLSIHSGSDGNEVANNVIWNGSSCGITVRDLNNSISGNILYNNWHAIHESKGGLNTITRNTISNNRIGIFVYGSCPQHLNLPSCTSHVSNNHISNNYVGILPEHSHYTNITGNIVIDNEYGIRSYGSVENNIVGNSLLNNEYGIYLRASVIDNRVYHNNIINNTFQGIDATGRNNWDNGYPSGGNFWSDYTGIDMMWGPYQDRLGSDGIGDTPHNLIGNLDHYPLTIPNGVTFFGQPTILDATLSGKDLENVTVTWELSPNDGRGLGSVVAYEVYRGANYDIRGTGYLLLTTLPNGTFEFVDSLSGEGDPNNYFYFVCATNLTGVSACSHNQAGKFTRSLSKGPNLVSSPLIQSDRTVDTVLQTVDWDKAWVYNSSIKEWKWRMRFKPYFGELEIINLADGVWVNAIGDSNLTVAGVVPTSIAISLHAGWNLVGFPSFNDSYTVVDLEAVIAVDRIEGFDGMAQLYFLRDMTDGDFLQAGFGYWINTASEAIWIVTNS
ncbi:MAG: NosD domain-containing protein [Candidatus Thorarchaeota archaeon]|jgi:parallel beta-helix repeat protein